MLKKFLVVLFAALFCACISGCGGKTIEGSPSEVVEQCQALKTNENAKVVVTGYDRTYALVDGVEVIQDDDSGKGSSVTAYFKEPTEMPGPRVTIEGVVDSSKTEPDHIVINDAKLVS